MVSGWANDGVNGWLLTVYGDEWLMMGNED